MRRISLAEKVELCIIPGCIVLAWLILPRGGFKVALGEIIAGLSLVILLQGLVRDLWLLRQVRRQSNATPARAARCMCVESALGITGVLGGLGLAGLGFSRPVFVSGAEVLACLGAALLTGFLLKDFVFEGSPFRIYREEHHAQVIFRWFK